ncbi:acetyltransferase [Thermobacillus composti KWC4]|jgi:GNAT superfamily N-acetyltransferase|uniref:Acetyltransferase n=1 Tax=Thermobacillus composti (strain DSM 18247 / JCM 13945 / KWC4) TaxID=717605 RepID=L0EBP8_THECK|nr:GNAT family N-acetyltransferase [Thermobacillus composti]AGA57106.1 acetyltransferase [Thermobacillus composti KWC4]
MEVIYRQYVISDDKSRIDVQTVMDFLAGSYWANRRPPERIRKSIENSICYGVYDRDNMIGFARVVTDGATMYYVCDVFVLEAYRGQGIGKKLIEIITNAPEFEWMTGILGTRDAHGLYERFGFERDGSRFMIRLPQARKT